jgi:L-rhamnose mutarotase
MWKEAVTADFQANMSALAYMENKDKWNSEMHEICENVDVCLFSYGTVLTSWYTLQLKMEEVCLSEIFKSVTI